MPKRESFLGSLSSAFIWKSLEKSTALIKHIIVATVVGLSVQLDVFHMSIALVGVLVFSWGRLIDVIAVPKMVEYHQQKDDAAFKSLAGSLFNFILLFSIVLALMIIGFRTQLAGVAYGFEPERKTLLAQSFFWLAPALILYLPFFQLASVFRAMRRFSILYRGEFLMGAVALLLVYLFQDHPQVLLWSYSGGVIASFCYLLFSARKVVGFRNPPYSADMRSILRSAPGIFTLQITHYLIILSDRWFISFLPKGNVGALAYGRMISILVLAMLNLRGAFLTIFSEMGESLKKKTGVYNDLFSLSVFVCLPASVFFIFYGRDVVALLLERGLFSSDDTTQVYNSLAGFSWSLLPMVVLGPVEQIFQVQGKINLLIWRKLIGMVINVVCNYLFLFVMDWGVFGIASASSVSYWCILLLSIKSASNIGLPLRWKAALAWFCWVLTGALLAGWMISFVHGPDGWTIFVFVKLLLFVIVVSMAGLLYPGSQGVLVRDTFLRIVHRKKRSS